MCRYFIRASTGTVEIDRGRYEELIAARRVLQAALALEEIYEVLIFNYERLEAYMLRQSLASALYKDTEPYRSAAALRSNITVRIMNLLTSARTFCDTVGARTRDCLNDPKALEQVKDLLRHEYDAHREYRFMETLRNYVQHVGLPVHAVVTRGARVGPPDDELLAFSLQASSLRKELAGRIKPQVLDELGERIDLVGAARRYVESLSTVQHEVRTMIDTRVASARATLESAANALPAQSATSEVDIHALRIEGDDEEATPLLLAWDDRRIELKMRNQKLSNLHRCLISNRTA